MSDTTSVHIDLTPDELRALDEWRAANKMPTRGEAVRHLIRLALKVACGSNGEADVGAAPD